MTRSECRSGTSNVGATRPAERVKSETSRCSEVATERISDVFSTESPKCGARSKQEWKTSMEEN